MCTVLRPIKLSGTLKFFLSTRSSSPQLYTCCGFLSCFCDVLLSCTTHSFGLNTGEQYTIGPVHQKYQYTVKQKCCLRLLLKILCFMLTKYSQSNILMASFAAAVKALLALCCAVKPVLKNEAKLTWQWPFQRSCYTVNMTAHPLVQLISDIFLINTPQAALLHL